MSVTLIFDAGSRVGNGLPNYGQVAQWLERCC